MTYKSFIKEQEVALNNAWDFWWPKPDFKTIEEYILNEYMWEIKDESMVKQRALLMWMEEYIKNNK